MPRPKTAAADYAKFMFRLPTDVRDACHRIALENHRSMNAQILHVLTEWLAREHQLPVRRRGSAERARRERTQGRLL
jgi:hypothetical protein